MKRFFTCCLMIFALPASANTHREADGAVQQAASWLDRQIEEIRSFPPGGMDRRAVETARNLPAHLERQGLSPDLAQAIGGTFDPSLKSSTKGALRSLEVAKRRLKGFSRALLRSRPHEPPGARKRLEAILADPVFQTTTPGSGPLQQFLAAVSGLLARLFLSLADSAAQHPLLLRALVIGLIAAALIAVAVKAPFRRRRRAASSGPVPPPPDDARESAPDLPQALIARARAASARGKFREAIEDLELAAVQGLRQRGLLPVHPGLTDLEGVRWLGERAAPEVHSPFMRLAQLYDRIVYGGLEAPGSAIEEAAALAEQLVQGVADSGPALRSST